MTGEPTNKQKQLISPLTAESLAKFTNPDGITTPEKEIEKSMASGSRQSQPREYVHTAPKSDHYLKTRKAITLVRTDHKALTLDKFLNQDSQKFNVNTSAAAD